ncbi:hypothetical protein DFJ63DRAFT_38982 [Scheffersomyces coipomensis]|uniref:uncharacterized protein n=1 Tax=Scheffersomyces coipomensis TaxID=1788519 RepID=UPI00315C98CD
MNSGDYLVFASQIVQLSNQLYQIKYNKAKKSIYGISYDYYVLNTINKLLALIVSLNYTYNSTIIMQYKARYPVHSLAVISPIIIIIDCGLLLTNGLILSQLFIIYARTKNVNQNVSGFNMLFLSFLLGGFLIVSKYYWFAELTFNYLDLINYLWLVSWLIAIVELCPQLVMNWFDDCCVGLHPQWLSFEIISLILNLTGWSMINLHFNVPWYQLPINYHGWCYLVMRSILLIIFSLQQFKCYKGKRPTLELYYYRGVSSIEGVEEEDEIEQMMVEDHHVQV